MARIGFVGTGAIAEAMVRGIAGQGHEIAVSERNPEVAARLATAFQEVEVRPNADVVAGSEIVVLCLMAGVARTVLPQLPFRADTRVISVMADMARAEVAALVAPAKEVSLTIPLPPVARGGCPMPFWPDTGSVREVFGARNPVISVADEAALNAHLAACALSLPVMAQLSAGIDWLAARTGDRAGAEAYVTAMFGSYFAAMAKAGDLAALMAELSTEGGLNAQLRDAMAEAGAPGALAAGLEALAGRLGLP